MLQKGENICQPAYVRRQLDPAIAAERRLSFVYGVPGRPKMAPWHSSHYALVANPEIMGFRAQRRDPDCARRY
jgi:hypothetical protein